MPVFRPLALAALAALGALPGTASADEGAVGVVFRGPVDPELAERIASELAASGRAPRVLDEGDDAAEETPRLEIHLAAARPYAVAHLAPGVSNAAPLSTGDVEAAALAAASLILEPPVRAEPSHAHAEQPSSELAPPEAPRAAPPMRANRGAVFDLEGTTGIFLNGGSIGVGLFLDGSWLLELHGRALHMLFADRFVAFASGSLAYVARVANVDLEAAVDVGLAAAIVPGNDAAIGTLVGGSVGVAIHFDPLAAVLVRLGGEAAELYGQWLPAILLSVGMRVAP
jgi:hypothetical protein